MNKNNKLLMYNKLAWLWPAFSPAEDYVNETKYFAGILRKHSKIKIKDVLHIGCGGGHNDFTLKKYFNVTGVDISPEMLSLARKLNPECGYIRSDMRSMKLGRKFDAVVAFDSINHINTRKDLLAVFSSVNLHLNPGGVFLAFIENVPETLKQNSTDWFSGEYNGRHVTVIENEFDRDTKDDVFEIRFVYIIHGKKKTDIYSECHVNGLFRLNTWKSLLSKSGFIPELMPVKSKSFPSDKKYYIAVCTKNLINPLF